jgi:hypothetical protein
LFQLVQVLKKWCQRVASKRTNTIEKIQKYSNCFPQAFITFKINPVLYEKILGKVAAEHTNCTHLYTEPEFVNVYRAQKSIPQKSILSANVPARLAT